MVAVESVQRSKGPLPDDGDGRSSGDDVMSSPQGESTDGFVAARGRTLGQGEAAPACGVIKKDCCRIIEAVPGRSLVLVILQDAGRPVQDHSCNRGKLGEVTRQGQLPLVDLERPGESAARNRAVRLVGQRRRACFHERAGSDDRTGEGAGGPLVDRQRVRSQSDFRSAPESVIPPRSERADGF